MYKNINIISEFKNPGATYRGKPFWAWNGKLEEKELRRQLQVMKEMGLGGAFMHSRTGLETEYLSDEWFKLINACADECRKLGMEAWLYDEDRWPSGAAGGLVTKKRKFRAKKMFVQIRKKDDFLKNPEKSEILFAAEIQNDVLFSYRKIKRNELAGVEENSIIACEIRTDVPSCWYNYQTYLDTMSKEAVKKFIEITHKAYKKECKEYWAKEIPGIFTDEPNYGYVKSSKNRAELPWTDVLPKVFKKRYNYNIIERIPEIIFRSKDAVFSKVRHDYFETITELFVQNFAKQIHDFCEDNGILFTGHVLSEESLFSQTRVVGSAMRFYEYMQAPGIDILCAQGLEREGGVGEDVEFLTAKQCSSVLNQMGRKWMLSELYGCTGWHFTLAEHKAVGDWQAALGVNLRCHHLSWYTMKGEAKRDYPASIFFQSPYWRDYAVVEDYFSRLNLMLLQGKPVIDIGVIHSIESAWGVIYQNPSKDDGWEHMYKKDGEIEHLVQLDKKLKRVQKILLRNHYDFEYIDESILEKHGSCSKSKLCVGKSSYSVIIVPPLFTIRNSTYKFLAKFAEKGGELIFIEKFPEMIDCEESDKINFLRKVAKVVRLEDREILESLANIRTIRKPFIRRVDGNEFTDCLSMMREDEKGNLILFICSTFQRSEDVELEIEVPAIGQINEWDCATGEIYKADYMIKNSSAIIRTSLGAYGSRLFVISKEEEKNTLAKKKLTYTNMIRFNNEKVKILYSEPNVFPLDMPEYSIDGKHYSEELEILRIDSIVRDSMGWERRSGYMCQPWADKDVDDRVVPVKLKYSFVVEQIPTTPCFIAIENPERFCVKLNDVELKYDELNGYFIDNSFAKIIVEPQILKVGENILELEINYSKSDSLEAIYFCGDFGFRWAKDEYGKFTVPTIFEAPKELPLGDWGNYGLPTYTGAITYVYEREFNLDEKKYILRISQWSGSLLKIYVNGRLAGKLAFPPYELDITTFLQNGRNEFKIEVVGTRRNLFGPLHNKNIYPRWTGPGEFKDYGQNWTDEYMRLPYGLFAHPEILQGDY